MAKLLSSLMARGTSYKRIGMHNRYNTVKAHNKAPGGNVRTVRSQVKSKILITKNYIHLHFHQIIQKSYSSCSCEQHPDMC